MAVKKANTKPTEKNVEVEVEETVVSNTEEQVEEAVEVEIEIPTKVEVEEPKVDVEVNTQSTNRPSGNAKIRMRVDHKCCIAMERYDLKAGKTYTVPENVKRILNKAGLLAPL